MTQEFNEAMSRVDRFKARVVQLSNEIKMLRADKKEAEEELHDALEDALKIHKSIISGEVD